MEKPPQKPDIASVRTIMTMTMHICMQSSLAGSRGSVAVLLFQQGFDVFLVQGLLIVDYEDYLVQVALQSFVGAVAVSLQLVDLGQQRRLLLFESFEKLFAALV